MNSLVCPVLAQPCTGDVCALCWVAERGRLPWGPGAPFPPCSLRGVDPDSYLADGARPFALDQPEFQSYLGHLWLVVLGGHYPTCETEEMNKAGLQEMLDSALCFCSACPQTPHSFLA